MQLLKRFSIYSSFLSIFMTVFASNVQEDATEDTNLVVENIQDDTLENNSSSVSNDSAETVARETSLVSSLSPDIANLAPENVVENEDSIDTTMENSNIESQDTSVDLSTNQQALKGLVSTDVFINPNVAAEATFAESNATNEHNTSFYRFKNTEEEEGRSTELNKPTNQRQLSKENSLRSSTSSFDILPDFSPTDISLNDEPNLSYPSVSSAGSHENIEMFRISLPSESDLAEEQLSGLSENEGLSDIDDVFRSFGNANDVRIPEANQDNLNINQQNESEGSSEIENGNGRNIIIPNSNHETEETQNMNPIDNSNGNNSLGNKNSDVPNQSSSPENKPKDDVSKKNENSKNKKLLKTVITIIIVLLSITILFLIVVLGIKNI